MVLPRCPKRRIRGKASPGVIHWVGKEEPLPSKLAQQLLPRLYSFTKGAGFNSQTFRVWLARLHPGTTAAEANAMLAKLSRSRLEERPEDPRPSPTAWLPSGVRFADPEGEANAQNLEGFEWQQLEKSKAMSWNEYGYVYRLQVKDANRSTYVVARSKNLKKASAMVSKRTLELDKKAIFRSCVVMDMPLSVMCTTLECNIVRHVRLQSTTTVMMSVIFEGRVRLVLSLAKRVKIYEVTRCGSESRCGNGVCVCEAILSKTGCAYACWPLEHMSGRAPRMSISGPCLHMEQQARQSMSRPDVFCR
ncbi:unnamed protein product [Effrenium voratum]|nr:unnamed protein product [Effrenium voratum]